MERRKYLALVGATAFAGCNSLAENAVEDSNTSDRSTPSGESATTQRQSATSTPMKDTEATVRAAEHKTQSLSYGDVDVVSGEVENTGTERLWSVVATGKFYDGEENLLTTSAVDVRDLVPGEIWDVWIRYPDGGSEVEAADIVISQAATPGRTYFPEGFSVVESDMEVPQEDARPIISASVENNSGVDDAFLLAVLKVYAENEHVLGTAITSTNNLSDGEGWQINRRVLIRNPRWIDRIADHEVVLLR